VLVDIAIDQGGCAETSRPTTHLQPIYVEEGVTHYCVAICGGVCAHATQALTNITYRYVELLADLGLDEACKKQAALIGGINTRDGKLTCRAVAEAHGLKYDGRCKAHAEMQSCCEIPLPNLCNYEEIHLHPGWRRASAACEQKTERSHRPQALPRKRLPEPPRRVPAPNTLNNCP